MITLHYLVIECVCVILDFNGNRIHRSIDSEMKANTAHNGWTLINLYWLRCVLAILSSNDTFYEIWLATTKYDNIQVSNAKNSNDLIQLQTYS